MEIINNILMICILTAVFVGLPVTLFIAAKVDEVRLRKIMKKVLDERNKKARSEEM